MAIWCPWWNDILIVSFVAKVLSINADTDLNINVIVAGNHIQN